MTTLAQIGLAPAGAASSTIAWFTLAGALGGVLLTGIIGLATVVLNHRWQARGDEQQRLVQHGAQVRQERRETYAAYWLAWNRLSHELGMVSLEVQLKGLANRASQKPHVQELAEKAWANELEWRAASDAMLLIAGPSVEKAARVHIAMTEQKLSAAWKGESCHDENGAAYRGLNDAMRADLLSPGKPEQWAP